MRAREGRSNSATAADLVRHLTDVGETVACAESLTGGLVAAAFADVPGASAVLRGGVVAYAADLKVSLLGVPAALIERVGTVHRDVALTLADGARARLGATWGLSTTGVAGPGPAEGKPAGTVYVAVGNLFAYLCLAATLLLAAMAAVTARRERRARGN